jgi:hypothetical protein
MSKLDSFCPVCHSAELQTANGRPARAANSGSPGE